MIEQYLRELINYYKNKGEWKLQLTVEINFISLKPGSDETRIMHTRSDNEETMTGSDTNEIIKGLFESFLQKYEENLQEKMKGSDFEFDGVRGGSYIDSRKWSKDKKSTINPKINDYKCFQYAVTLALNLDNIISLFTHCSFNKIKNKLDYYRGHNCMKKFCKDLREHATKIINFAKKKMIPLTKKEKENHNKQKVCYICKKKIDTNDKKNYKVRDHCHYSGKYRVAVHNICNLRYKIPKEIPIVFHNGSTYDYHFIIKELVKEFDGNFECLGENTEKYITFSVPLKKKIENKNVEITYKIKFIDSFRFMSSSLSKLVDNLSEGLHNNKCLDCESCLDYVKTKNEKLILKCFNCKTYYEKDFNKELIKRFASTYEFCNKNLNKRILLLRKGAYPYEYMDNWQRFNETSLLNKESFYSNLNMENIDDIDYRHGNNVFKRFKLKNLGEYHDLYVQSNTLLLADVFENFRNFRKHGKHV